MNPGELNKRLTFQQKNIVNGQEILQPLYTVWGKKIVKTVRRDNEQNEESYNFIVRKRPEIDDYLMFQCENIWYDVLTVEEYQKEKGYLLLKCEKARIHSFYDNITVSRPGWAKNEYGASKPSPVVVYESIPCELIKMDSSSVDETQQETDFKIKYVLHLETKYTLKIGDSLVIKHKQDTYNALVEDFFRYHTYQELTIRMEGEA